MITTMIEPTSPGEYLSDFMEGRSNYSIAKESGLSATQIGEIISGKRKITVLTALKLARVFGTSPELWMNLQTKYDLFKAASEHPELVAV